MIIQFCGMSGTGKTTLAQVAATEFKLLKYEVEVLDSDEYRNFINKDLGFSKADRIENIQRLGFIANKFCEHNILSIICAINPYEKAREELRKKYRSVKTVFIDCNLEELIKRDTKGLYKKALLPEGHSDKLNNLTGINDPFEIPENPDLVIHTDKESVDESAKKLIAFIQNNLSSNVH